MSTDRDTDTVHPPPPGLDRALRALRLHTTGGPCPIADRALAARLLVELELDGPAPQVCEGYGQVLLRWINCRSQRETIGIVRGGFVLANTFERGELGAGRELPLGRRLDRLRGLVIWARGGCEGGCEDELKGD